MADTAGTRTSRKNKDDLVKDSQAIIRGPETAKKWLTENELTLKGEELTMSTMAATLIQLCSGRFPQPKEMICGMRAIAICMEKIIHTRYTTNALDTVKEQVDDIVKEAKDAIEELVGEVRTVMKDTEEQLKKQKETRTSNDVEKIIEKAVQSATKPTYAQALANSANPCTATRDLQIKNDAKARSKLHRRQIILDGDDATKEQASKLTLKELILKANLALEKLDEDMAEVLQDDNNERPDNTKFVAARILKNGGILFEMESENGTNWLKQPKITKAFENCFPGVVTVKGNNYQVVVQFLPVRLRNHLDELHAVIENENNLTKGSIANFRWLRNPDNWGANQIKAHAVISLRYRTDANNIINGGLLIDGSRHDTRKLEEDPKCCFRCQIIGLGHTATSCKSQEACSNCAKDHTTSECRATWAEFSCATCKKDKRQDDHTSWDRQCPAFIEEKARLRDRKPENHFRFFPTEHEPWTWVRHEDSLADGFTDRWTGNDSRRGPQQPRDTRRDDGWGRPLGQGPRGTTDTWTPRSEDTRPPAGSNHRPRNQQQRSNRGETSRKRTETTQDPQRHNNRSCSKGRPTQQHTQKNNDPRQRSLIDWARPSEKSRERRGTNEAPTGRNRPETEYCPSQASRR